MRSRQKKGPGGFLKILIFIVFALAVFFVKVSVDNTDINYQRTFFDADKLPLLIDTPGYKLPDFDPFHETVKRFILPTRGFNCGRHERPITTARSDYIRKKNDKSKYDVPSLGKMHNMRTPLPTSPKQRKKPSNMNYECVLVTHPDHLKDYGHTSATCKFREILKSEGKDDFSLGEWRIIKNKITKIRSTSILVQCSNGGTIFYRNIHNFVQRKFNKVTFKAGREETKSSDHYSVIILGIDSVSRLNMMRYMPKTRDYLNSIHAVELKGFNRYGLNTYPNVVSLLTGLSRDNLFQNEYLNSSEFYDEVPFIWKSYAKRGYSTFLAEDCPTYNTFNYNLRHGFRNLPVDGYLRPSFLVSEGAIGYAPTGKMLCRECLGQRTPHQVLVDYADDISVVLKDKNYFAYIWSTTLSHDVPQNTGLLDVPTLEYFKKMKSGGYWDNTIVIFLADHGIRFGDIRNTYMGSKEESLPFGYVLLPENFPEKYPMGYKNILANQFKLTTHSDIHATLEDILDLSTGGHIGNGTGVSLFQEIPINRTCASVNIPMKFCGGVKFVNNKIESHLSQTLGKYIFDYLNQLLKPTPQCCQFKDFSIKNVGEVVIYGEKKNDYSPAFYQISLITHPGEAQLEALIKVDNDTTTKVDFNKPYIFSLVSDVSRTNAYRGQSDCVYDEVLERYCYCRYLLN